MIKKKLYMRVNPRDDQEYRGSRNISQDYKNKKRKGEKYTDWVVRESDEAFLKFILWLIIGVPIALILIGIIMAVFGE